MAIDLAAAGFSSIDEYQRFHGLPATGVMNRETMRSFHELRTCGLPDRMDLGGRVCLWGKRQLSCAWIGTLQGISDEQVTQAIVRAWSAWQAVCGIKVSITDQPNSADITVTAMQMDGTSNVLARAALPCGQDQQRPVEVDQEEPWVTVVDPPRYRVSLVLTLIHEFGHTLGLVHGPPGSIMQPTHDPRTKVPQAWDIAEAQQRYGAPAADTVPDVPLPIPLGEFVNIRIPRAWVG